MSKHNDTINKLIISIDNLSAKIDSLDDFDFNYAEIDKAVGHLNKASELMNSILIK